MGIFLTAVGPAATIQDAGRAGYAAFGFQTSGAMDKRAFNTANFLAGNDKDEAAIEMTLLGISGEFTSDAVIAFTGADVSPEINGAPIPLYRAVAVKKGDVLKSGFAKNGCRAYLAVQGGFYLKKALGSYSTNIKCKIGGYMGRPLKKEDLLYFNTVTPLASAGFTAERYTEIPPAQTIPAVLRVVLGPQDDYFTENGIKTFLNSEYALTNDSDRMGIKLSGAAVESKNGADIISDGIPLGAVQIPSSGMPVIMAADRQTVGGYAKIATVISVDMPVIAQLKPGDSMRFSAVTPDEARRIYLSEYARMRDLKERFPEVNAS
ncbi:MAG: biotin-dependent carboxyltransferase family protein [Clostridiales bacterium]|nr:biotin-dependent carboxyltransferase family protein [Clostridiales bacterium]